MILLIKSLISLDAQDIELKFNSVYTKDDAWMYFNPYSKISRLSKYLNCLVLIIIALSSCSSPGSDQDPVARETQIELNVRQTIAAQQSARQTPVAPTRSPEETTPEISLPTPTDTVLATLSPEAPQPDAGGDFETWMKTANILLYEDMVNNSNTNRYVKSTLAAMGIECSQKEDLPCTDVGSAQGWFRENLEKGSIDGKPWDLVIVSSEYKGGVNELRSSLPTDFYGLLEETLDQGIPVILEIGDLDKSFASSAKDILERCGISFESDWERIPPSRMVMFPLAEGHPVLNEPNGDLSFSQVTDIWITKVRRQFYDLGDLVSLTPEGNATLLLGTTANQPSKHGTLTSCADGLLLLQTFSSHQLTFNSMKLVWENYIYNQLRQRFERLP